MSRFLVFMFFYDELGRKVTTLADGELTQGQHSYVLNADRLLPGIYYCILKTGQQRQSKA